MTTKYKVETGAQLLARLTKKREIENFYPILFENSFKPGEVAEIFSSGCALSSSAIIIDLVAETILLKKFRGSETGVLVFNTDGNFNFEELSIVLQDKILARNQGTFTEKTSNNTLRESLQNFFMLDIFDATQLYTTIQNLESILLGNIHISLIIIDTITAFYWSEQVLKIIRMDLYLKNLLAMLQKVTKEYSVSIIYSRPEYFSSGKEQIENLEACCQHPTLERINYRIRVLLCEDGCFQTTVKTYNKIYTKKFCVINNKVNWLPVQ